MPKTGSPRADYAMCAAGSRFVEDPRLIPQQPQVDGYPEQASVGVEETVLKTFLEVLPGQKRKAPFRVFVVRVDLSEGEH
jgi:hypothetical protein